MFEKGVGIVGAVPLIVQKVIYSQTEAVYAMQVVKYIQYN
jgi:hypothetical protein